MLPYSVEFGMWMVYIDKADSHKNAHISAAETGGRHPVTHAPPSSLQQHGTGVSKRF
jgi:hypothetical protein